jgi:hypothetical protein
MSSALSMPTDRLRIWGLSRYFLVTAIFYGAMGVGLIVAGALKGGLAPLITGIVILSA